MIKLYHLIMDSRHGYPAGPHDCGHQHQTSRYAGFGMDVVYCV